MRSVPFHLRLTVSSVLILILSTTILSVTAVAQEAGPQQIGGQKTYARPLINQAIDEGQRIVLKGNVHPLARAQFQVGAAPLDLPMQRMLLVLKRSPEQDQALLKLLDDQQDKSSPSYHKWLTPEQFGQQFGPADSDIQAVTSWLQSHGLQIARVSKGRVMIEFSGTAAQLQEAFHTAIRKYAVNGETHWANASDPEIPAALAPVVAGVHTLHNFYMKPLHVISNQRFSVARQPGSARQFTGSDGSHALVPADYAIIYNINPVYQAGIDGTGTTIAVIGRSEFIVQDVVDLQSAFSLPPNPPQIVNDGPTPGDLGGGEEAEATLDATWSAAVAPGATVKFVVSASTDTTDGIVLSELYIIENNVGDVMSESFGGCEANVSSTEAAGFEALAQEAAAQGITYIVSSGDTGTAGCDNLGEKVATGPVSASVLAATPFTVAVGGTMFNENGHDTTYWNTTNSALLASAKSYIPENVWNETCTTQCPAQASPLAASGGGVSVFFAKPPWQTGVAGIPTDGFRDVPDVSLTAAGHDPYLLCVDGSCQSGNAFGVSGTSASAPAFAGIMALVNQKTGSRQGQANYVLYKLAMAETLSQCNGSNTTTLPANTCVFNDVTIGNNGVPGEPGYGTPSAQFQSTVGYDQSTGLGSVNVSNLLNHWSSVAFRATTTTLALTPPSFTHGASANVNISVTPSSGSGTPTGDVSLLTNSSAMQGVTFFTLNNGAISDSSDGLPGGTYAVHAHYAGDATFAPSDSAPVTITVSPEASTTTLSVLAFDVAGNTIPFNSQPYGNPAFFRADVAGVSNNGTATGGVTFTDNATNITGDPFSLNSEAAASTTQGVFTMPPGPHAIVAHYGGDAGFNASTSSTVNVTVTQAPTTIAVTSSASSVAQGTPVTLTATVSTNSGGAGPSGQVTFLAGGTPIVPGSPVSVVGVSGSGNIQNGALTAAQGAAVSVITLPTGQNSITAQYSGDANYLASPASAAITVNVLPDFSFTAAAPSVTIASPGGSGTVMLTITGQPGYNGTVNFSATSCAGLPSESTCSFSPASVTGNGSTTLTIATTAAHHASLQDSGWWTTGLGGALAGVFLLGGASRRQAWSRLLSVMAFAFVITIAGCGGGGSGGGGNTDPGTPVGASTVTVTATSGPITHTATLTLNVQ
jgi:hypothetical protein